MVGYKSITLYDARALEVAPPRRRARLSGRRAGGRRAGSRWQRSKSGSRRLALGRCAFGAGWLREAEAVDVEDAACGQDLSLRVGARGPWATAFLPGPPAKPVLDARSPGASMQNQLKFRCRFTLPVAIRISGITQTRTITGHNQVRTCHTQHSSVAMV